MCNGGRTGERMPQTTRHGPASPVLLGRRKRVGPAAHPARHGASLGRAPVLVVACCGEQAGITPLPPPLPPTLPEKEGRGYEVLVLIPSVWLDV